MVTILIYLSKTFISGTLFRSKQFFYFFILLFTAGRTIFFILELVLIIFLNSVKYKYIQTELSKLSIGIFHVSSTLFYTAIFFAVIHWAELKITSGVMSENVAYNSLKYPKYFIYFVLLIVYIIQIILFIIRMVINIQPREKVDLIDAAQYVYHSFLCWGNVFLCLIFMIYTIHLEWKGFKSNDSQHSKLFIVICFIQIFIFSKGIIHLTLAILEYLSFIQQTHPVATIINGISLILLDLVPTILITFSMIHFGEVKRTYSFISIEKVY